MRAARQDGFPGGAAGASLALHLGAGLWLVLGGPAPGGPPVRELPLEIAFVAMPTSDTEAATPAPSLEALEARQEEAPESAPSPTEPPPLEVTQPGPVRAAPLPEAEALAEPVTAPAEQVAQASSAPAEPLPEPEALAEPPTKPVAQSTAPPIAAAPPTPALPQAVRPRSPRPTHAQRREPLLRAAYSAAAGAATGAALPHTPVAAAPPAPGPPPLITQARYRQQPTPPAYPPRAIAFRMSGTALIRALVGPDGLTRELRLHRSSGHAELDQAALAAVRGWTFAAATQGGQPIEAWVEVPVRFRLDD